MTKRAMNKGEMLPRSDLGTGLRREMLLPEIRHGVCQCYGAMQSRRESGGLKANPLFQRLCQVCSDVFILSSHPTCQHAGYVKRRYDAKWESGQWGGELLIRQGSDPCLTPTSGSHLLQVLV